MSTWQTGVFIYTFAGEMPPSCVVFGTGACGADPWVVRQESDLPQRLSLGTLPENHYRVCLPLLSPPHLDSTLKNLSYSNFPDRRGIRHGDCPCSHCE